MSDIIARAMGKKALSTPKSKIWTTTNGQLIYTLDEPYASITVYIDGVPQINGIHFIETTSTSITLNCQASDIVAGMNVIATYK